MFHKKRINCPVIVIIHSHSHHYSHINTIFSNSFTFTALIINYYKLTKLYYYLLFLETKLYQFIKYYK